MPGGKTAQSTVLQRFLKAVGSLEPMDNGFLEW